MKSEYCHYILNKNKSEVMYGAAPKDFKKRSDFLDDFNTRFSFNEKRWPAFNSRIVESIELLLYDSGIIDLLYLGNDARCIYDRCVSRIPQINPQRGDDGYLINYDIVFEILSDFIWIYISQKYAEDSGKRKAELVSSFQLFHNKVFSLYDKLIYYIREDECECDDMEEALEKKGKFIVGMFSNDRAFYYYNKHNREDINDMISIKKRRIECAWYMYYALIATSVRYEELRRGRF